MKKIRNFLLFFVVLTLLLALADKKFNSAKIITVVTDELSELFDSLSNKTPQKTRPSLTVTPVVESPQSGKLKLASWNIRVFSSKSRDDNEISQICDVMQNFDFIAIQEIRDTEALDRCVSLLSERGLKFEYISSPRIGTKTQKEIYAFMYRSDMVSCKRKGQVYNDRDNIFIREPYYATFQAGTFDFTIATVHLLYGSGKKAP